MKKFKDIRNTITETHEYAIGNSPSVGYGRYQVDKSDEETLNNIQQAINHELSKGYMSPTSAINNLRTKLNFVGFDFDLKDVPTSGKVSFPLKNATETFGKKVDTPFDKFDKDDSSTGLTLTVTISQDDDSLYKLNGKIS
jgi:hypothetical protein|tara:strand:+ start:2806 stop:3225 length:420 start_codon:yes stop_codon:yes gene_type:complete